MGRYNKTVHQKQHTNMGWAICTVFLCFPIGFFALFIAWKSRNAWKEGRPENGGDMAEIAKTISLFGILLSIIIISVFIALWASGKLYELMYKVGIISWNKVEKWSVNLGNPRPVTSAPITEEPEYYYDYDYGEPNGVTGDDEYYYYTSSTTSKPGK